MQLWQVVLAVITTAGAIFGGVGFWTYLSRRFDEGTSIRKELREDHAKLEETVKALQSEVKEGERACAEKTESLKSEMAEMKIALVEEKANRKEFEDLVLNMIRFRPHDRDGWFGVEQMILERRRNPDGSAVLARPIPFQRKCHVLVVDDEPDTTKFLAIALKMAGFDVHTANNGPDALQQFSSMRSLGQHFDLVLLDYTMPGMDGFDVAVAIRAMETPHCVPVKITFLTGTAETLRDEMLAQIGAETVLGKPVDIDVLKARLDEMFKAQPVS